MIFKTRGIVFRFTKFQETSIIVTIFTDRFGLQSYMVNGVRSKSAKNKIALYQPLTLLNLVVYHREHANIERIREVSCLHPYHTLTSDIRKSTQAMFLAEILNKTVKEESHTAEVFDFIATSLITLDSLPARYENFHLLFLLKLSRFLGFGIYNAGDVLDIDAGKDIDKPMQDLLRAEYETPLNITSMQRQTLLDLLLRFYARHIEHLGEIKSVQVLREIFQ